jgi:hypothetical protein
MTTNGIQLRYGIDCNREQALRTIEFGLLFVRQAAGSMKQRIVRAILGVLCLVYVPVYLFVLFVALATSGDEIIREPGAWYAAVAPLAYVGFVGAYAFGLAKRRMSRATLVAVHIGVAPALMYSFLGLGLLLPAFAALFWWFMKQEQVPAAA